MGSITVADRREESPRPSAALSVVEMLQRDGLPLAPSATAATAQFLSAYVGETWLAEQISVGTSWVEILAPTIDRRCQDRMRAAFPGAFVADADRVTLTAFGWRLLLLTCGALHVVYVIHPIGGAATDCAILPLADVVSGNVIPPRHLAQFNLQLAISALEDLLSRRSPEPMEGVPSWAM